MGCEMTEKNVLGKTHLATFQNQNIKKISI